MSGKPQGKRLVFAQEYLKDLNATQAAIRSGRVNHKRGRAKAQRAGCNCGGKLAKNLRATRRSGGRACRAYGSAGRELRLAERMREMP